MVIIRPGKNHVCDPHLSPSLGAVIIGRNEGVRLQRCLGALMGRVTAITYVDSGSTDDSVDLASSMDLDVVELDLSRPVTAGRARNAGFERLLAIWPGLSFVQFIDGDCEIAADWLERAQAELRRADNVAIVCGRRRERLPDASVYNLLCDLEWNTLVGDADACGGDFMIRADAFREVGGFDADFIAGEEPELCLRLRKRGWRILRVDAEMTLHDATLTRFSQWWTRATRAGHAYAQTAWTHPRPAGWRSIRAVLSMTLWALLLPLLAVGLAWPSGGLSLLLLGTYPLQWVRIARAQTRRGRSGSEARIYAAFVLLGKFAQARGAERFLRSRLLRRSGEIIEYKVPPDDPSE